MVEWSIIPLESSILFGIKVRFLAGSKKENAFSDGYFLLAFIVSKPVNKMGISIMGFLHKD
jgi:hypothetical protein